MFAALVALTLSAPAAAEDKEKPLPEAAQKELKKLDGKWKGVKLVVNEAEQTDPEVDGAAVVLEFKGRKILFQDKDLLEIADLDPATDPKCLDLKALRDLGGISKGTVYEAVYKLDGDTLTIALNVNDSKSRPSKFESPKDSNVAVVTLKKEKN